MLSNLETPRPPVIFECTACTASHNSRDHHIPIGWSQQGASIWCADCTSTAAPRVLVRRAGR